MLIDGCCGIYNRASVTNILGLFLTAVVLKMTEHVFIQKGCLFISPGHSFFQCSMEALTEQEGGLCNLKDALPKEISGTGISAWEGMGGQG